MYNFSKKSISKIISIFLISSLLFCACSTTSFAATGNLDFNAIDLPFYAEYYDTQNNTWVSLNSTRTLTTLNGMSVCRYDVPRITEGVSNTRYCITYRAGSLKANHEYSLSFSYAVQNLPTKAHFNVYLHVLDSNDNVVDVSVLYQSPTFTNDDNQQLKNVSFNFVPDLSSVTTGYNCKIVFEFQQEWNTYVGTFYLSNNLYFNDNDDDSAWYQSIINWLQSIAGSISSLGTNIGNWFSQLGTTIGNYFTTLGNNLNTWLTNVKDGIVNKLQSVQTAITNAIDGIQQWFVNLGNRIGEFFTMLKNYILYFQHPVTLNADGVPVDGNGNPVYTNPFDDTLDSVSDTLDDWFNSLDDFILTIRSVDVEITGYLQTFTNIFNRFNDGVSIIGVIITLALIVIVIKKIMGR